MLSILVWGGNNLVDYPAFGQAQSDWKKYRIGMGLVVMAKLG